MALEDNVAFFGTRIFRIGLVVPEITSNVKTHISIDKLLCYSRIQIADLLEKDILSLNSNAKLDK